MEEYKIKLEMFEGPFDLLLHLIDKNEVDIYDIPIAEITAQYLEYIDHLKELDLNVASEFLVMAATLLAIKAKMLLPKPPVEEVENEEDLDPRAKLVHDLLEYKKSRKRQFAWKVIIWQGKSFFPGTMIFRCIRSFLPKPTPWRAKQSTI